MILPAVWDDGDLVVEPQVVGLAASVAAVEDEVMQ